MSETLHLNPTETKTKTSAELLTADGFQEMVEIHGLDGETASERIGKLKQKGVMDIAVFLDAINRSVQGSETSRINTEKVMRIGEQETIDPSQRYDVFTKLIQDIQETPDTVNPARVGDVLALGVVLLHPFEDGNGRTARSIGLLFRDEYDSPDYQADFTALSESRDDARARGGFLPYGYTPRFPDGFDQTDPTQVSGYLESLLKEPMDNSYIGPYGQAPLES